jgi:hypothetical protein
MNLKAMLTRWWCDWTHGGGDIKRDLSDRINWQCRKCGRWSEHPVPTVKEYLTTEAAIRARGEK